MAPLPAIEAGQQEAHVPLLACRATPQERRSVMLADSLVPRAVASSTHAITIHAPPERVWQWVAQMGAGRAGWYSYDCIDNGGRPSAEEILPEFQRIAPEDILPATPGREDVFRVAAVEPPRRLVLTVPESREGTQVSWEFLLLPLEGGDTRLIVRGRISKTWPSPTRTVPGPAHHPILIERVYSVLARAPAALMLPVAGFGHYIMEARMLRGIRRRAEA